MKFENSKIERVKPTPGYRVLRQIRPVHKIPPNTLNSGLQRKQRIQGDKVCVDQKVARHNLNSALQGKQPILVMVDDMFRLLNLKNNKENECFVVITK